MVVLLPCESLVTFHRAIKLELVNQLFLFPAIGYSFFVGFRTDQITSPFSNVGIQTFGFDVAFPHADKVTNTFASYCSFSHRGFLIVIEQSLSTSHICIRPITIRHFWHLFGIILQSSVRTLRAFCNSIS